MKWSDRIAAVAFLIAIFAMSIIASDYAENKRIMNEARTKFHSEETSAQSEPSDVKNEDLRDGSSLSLENMEESESILEKASLNVAKTEKFDKMKSVNSDYAGWLSIKGTNVDYPVVKGKDNNFYLNHGFDRELNVAGSIFMDYRNKGDGTDENIIIYGHNMKNGTMFKGLMEYKRKGFFEANRFIHYNDGTGESIWEIFSVYVTDTGFNYIRTDFTDMQFDRFVRALSEKSMHKLDQNIENIDNVLTLSTCSYEFDDARFVVHARKIKTGKDDGAN
ncbi:MAG TPA: class B sortase [Clostridia bacterium]|nr:class B sortase [Clostridia bacterium]